MNLIKHIKCLLGIHDYEIINKYIYRSLNFNNLIIKCKCKNCNKKITEILDINIIKIDVININK